MRYLSSCPLLLCLVLIGCVPHANTLDHVKTGVLWNATTADGAFVELRCRGMSPAAVRKRLAAQFKDREERIEAVLGPRRREEYIPIGRKCPFYRDALLLYERRIAELQRRLGLPSP